ncbi:AAA family ATPase [Nitrososphaera viennensis]|uniref:AAA family ATPase n=2 Tax=Nitrososphaera viennensis TaxID=1034015 RepID=A0A977IBS7_9ARCH|nr:AAA family ATPase [Nitrososphaera viennensis]AIC15933.1 putative DNA double-strand break repair Rad50 ATPase [Nitrososphaera viennensis EN76]UVS67916.1 AAA family ATPase [Nitrososphaera viennensis]
MIKDLELKDFISHKETRMEFGRGITIFVGHNGAGKSSVIDAITYSLFGEHMRKANKNLVRRGASGQAVVRMRFTLNGREFQVARSLTTAGSAAFSQLELVSDAGKQVNKKLAGGERKQYGESTSAEVAKVLGLDYKKLRVAAVVQQGELARIVEAQPKEFKELINGLIGIDRLDLAFSTMKDVIAGFRDRLRDETGGYTDLEMSRLQEQLAKSEKELADAERLVGEYEEEKARLEGRLRQLESEIERLEPLREKAAEAQAKEKQLIKYVNEKRDQVAGEAARLERVVREAKSALATIAGKEENCIRLSMVKDELEEVQRQIEKSESDAGKMRGLLECAGRLQLTGDGRCPVCNSQVSRINDMFDTAHIQAEVNRIASARSSLQVERVNLKKEEQKLAEEGKKIASAEAFLSGNSIASQEDVSRIEVDLALRREALSGLPKEIIRVDDPHALAIDDASRALAEDVASIREKARSFSPAQYTAAKDERWKVMQKLQDASARMGSYRKAAEDAKNVIDFCRTAAKKLEAAAGFVGMLERIRSLVYNRDGAVGMSLRSWALGTISKKASEYATLFNIGISRIELAEKAREIAITCYGRNGEVDMDSLSGGEKVAVALALRLGIAYMMGASKLDFVILDEPTTHLDEERRKALVRIISEAFREGAGPLAQMIIITHDADIFEDSEVDAVFRFSMTADGSRVVRE